MQRHPGDGGRATTVVILAIPQKLEIRMGATKSRRKISNRLSHDRYYYHR